MYLARGFPLVLPRLARAHSATLVVVAITSCADLWPQSVYGVLAGSEWRWLSTQVGFSLKILSLNCIKRSVVRCGTLPSARGGRKPQ